MCARRGVVLAEVVVGLVVLAVAVALVSVLGDRSRRLAGAQESLSNLRHLGAAFESYAGSNTDRIASFSWTRNNAPVTRYPDLAGPYNDDIAAAAAQAVDILRRQSGKTASEMPPISNWIPFMIYGHLPLIDFISAGTPAPYLVSPGDAERIRIRRDGYQNWVVPNSWRWEHSSSYELNPYAYNPDAGNIRSSGGVPSLPTIYQNTNWNQWAIHTPSNSSPTPWLGQRRTHEVAFPSAKVMMNEQVQRFYGERDAYFMYPEARVPVLMHDGSAAVRRTAEANNSYRPEIPTRTNSTIVNYDFNPSFDNLPNLWPLPLFSPNDSLDARYRWTRSGLRGRDFDGPEVPWQW